MKKLFAVAAFALVSQVGFAQQQVDEAFKKDVLRVIEIQDGGEKGMDKEIAEISEKIPKEKRAAFIVEFNAMMSSYKDKMADVYMVVYTKEDLKELLAFYESPFWKKLSEKKKELATKTKEISMELMMGMMPLMMKYGEEK